jgi:hypothetical protein
VIKSVEVYPKMSGEKNMKKYLEKRKNEKISNI